MSAPPSALLIDAPVGRHFAQLHRHEDGIVSSVGLFVETGLRRGHGVAVLAGNAHTELFLDRLRHNGLDPEAARRSGQLVVRDAHELVAQVMNGGELPDWRKFRQCLGTIFEGIMATGRTTVRAYGEMVSVLWRAGKPSAAILLEEYWNELGALYPFSLFCGYMLDGHQHDTYRSPLQEIGRTHTDVLPTDDDERLRDALNAVSWDVFGVPLDGMLRLSHLESQPGEQRLPGAHRTMLWMMRHLPGTSAEVLKRAKRYLGKQAIA